ncbi:PepSY domain-containing protein [Parasphingorhabdus sp.]|uniref:PepSY domain-containing protein n=1 Tax=Parasphingorhabdus sp. TaxID=2709688 RepID=UPI002F94C40A
MSTKVHIKASKIHKWLALIIGAQLLLWFVSGSVMSILPIETVRSEHLVSLEAPPIGNINGLVSPRVVAAKIDGPIRSLRYRMLMDRPVAEVIDMKETTYLFDGLTGKPRRQIGKNEALNIAEKAWIDGEPDFTSVAKINQNSIEYRGALPAWQVSTDDDVRIFIPLATGDIAAVRSPTWRFYDFFWSLHIMDWKNHENFNSWWLIAFALSGVVMSVSGLTLLVKRWPLKRRQRKNVN